MSKSIRINGMIRGMIERDTFHRLLLVVIFLFNVERPYFVGRKSIESRSVVLNPNFL